MHQKDLARREQAHGACRAREGGAPSSSSRLFMCQLRGGCAIRSRRDGFQKPARHWFNEETGVRALLVTGTNDVELTKYTPASVLLGPPHTPFGFETKPILGMTVQEFKAAYPDSVTEGGRNAIHLDLAPTEFGRYWTRLNVWTEKGKIHRFHFGISYEQSLAQRDAVLAQIKAKFGEPRAVAKRLGGSLELQKSPPIQIATAVILSHLGPWEAGPGRAALYSMVSGPSDWITIAGIVALAWRACDGPSVRAEVESAFAWLRSLIPTDGFTPWEDALAYAWQSLGGHPEPRRADLQAWIDRYEETLTSKNAVRTLRRYGGMTIEQYAAFSVERDRIVAGLGYGGPAAMLVGFSPPQALVALCQRANMNPQMPFIAEWQEALNASRGLMNAFIEAKSAYELEKLGVSGDEKAALDEIRGGDMDMHQRMAQAQQAQTAVAAGDAGEPNPLVFPGQKVARLSDYVGILKGMQTGDMMGALAKYGLDMMSYGSVAQAWAAKMAADPVLTEKFSQMMK